MHLARYIPDDEMQGSRKKERLGDQMDKKIFELPEEQIKPPGPLGPDVL